jgi:hypothetical protein
MEVLLGAVADAANKGEGDKLNILGIFHQIMVQDLPAPHPQLALALEFRAAPHEKGKTFDLQIVLANPDGGELNRVGAQLALAKEIPTLTPVIPMVLTMHGLVFPTAGNYRFEIRINGELKYEVPLEVQLLPKGFGPA